jgi:uncharacterized DUF497 family protein
MDEGFRWNEWNLDHATRHGVTPTECEIIVRKGKREYVGDGKFRVVGRGEGDRWVQVVYCYDPDEIIYVIHARPLNDREKRRERRRRK